MTRTNADGSTGPVSAWIAALKTLHGRIAAAAAALAVLATAAEQLFDVGVRLGVPAAWSRATLATIFVLCAGRYLVMVRRIRADVPVMPYDVFVGAEAFTERDQERFFGRAAEIAEIGRTLTDPQVRCFVLLGPSGCGKTSLIRAGLMPALKNSATTTTYARLYDHPGRELEAAAATPGGANVSSTPVLFVDQFDELFTSRIDEAERTRVYEWIAAAVRRGDLKVVLAIRQDFFHHLTALQRYIPDLLERSRTRRIEPLSAPVARTVIRQSLERAGVSWERQLLDRVVDDLQTDRTDGGLREPIVLPAELQIVCQMIQRKGWSAASSYPGKERLIHDYVSDAIEGSTNPNLTRRLLVALVHENGLSRSEPRSAAALAQTVNATESAVAAHLQRLDRVCRLVDQVARRDDRGESVIGYELAHDYLVTIINAAAGVVMDRTRRANLLLREYRTRAALDPRLTVAFGDVRLIRAAASDALTPQDRKLLRRSETTFWTRSIASVVLPVMAVLAIRYGTSHASLLRREQDTSRVVVCLGLPVLQPILGSREVVLDPGLVVTQLSDAGYAKVAANHWTFGFGTRRWQTLFREWHESYLQERVERGNYEILDAAHFLSLSSTSRAVDHRRLLEAVREHPLSDSPRYTTHVLTTLGVPRAELIATLQRAAQTRNGFIASSAAISLANLGALDAQSEGGLRQARIRCRREPARDELLEVYRSSQASMTLETWPTEDWRPHVAPDRPAPWAVELLKTNVATQWGHRVACAADALTRLGHGDEVVEGLRKRLGNAELVDTRVVAADRILRSRPDDLDARKTLQSVLRDAQFSAAAAAVIGERKIRDTNLDEALFDLLSTDEEVSMWAAAAALVRSGHRSEALTAWLLQQLRSGKEYAPYSAADLLLEIPQSLDEVRLHMRRRLQANEAYGAAAAAAVLVRAGDADARVRDALLHAIHSSESSDLKSYVVSLQRCNTSRSMIADALASRLNARDVAAASAMHELVRLGVRTPAVLARSHATVIYATGVGNDDVFDAYAELTLTPPNMPLDAALAALERAFHSPIATRSYGYRHAVQRGFVRLASRPEAAAAVRSKLKPLLSSPAIEFSTQLAAWRTTRMIDSEKYSLGWDPYGAIVGYPD